MNDAEIRNAIHQLLNRAGKRLEVIIRHCPDPSLQSPGSWTWADEHLENERMVSIRYWRNPNSSDVQILSLRCSPILTIEEQSTFVFDAFKKISELRARAYLRSDSKCMVDLWG
jgi:hypothetical protein